MTPALGMSTDISSLLSAAVLAQALESEPCVLRAYYNVYSCMLPFLTTENRRLNNKSEEII